MLVCLSLHSKERQGKRVSKVTMVDIVVSAELEQLSP